jgi:DNA-binding response OmpR family regulator
MAKILLVEDDNELRGTLLTWLAAEGYVLEECQDGESAIGLLEQSEFDVIVLDWDLPGISGFEVLRQYRKNGGQARVIFLTGKGQVEDKEAGLDGGADDYLTKPFKVKELSARIRSLLRRFKAVGESLIVFADLQLDASAKSLTRGTEKLKLPPREFSLLEFLMRRKNETFSAHDLLRHVWSTDSQATDQTVRTCVKRLRQIIDIPGNQSYIDNIHGHGYRMNVDLLRSKADD